MPSTDSTKRAILYARVSTDDDLLQDPKKISAGMVTLIAQERATGPRAAAKEAKACRQKIAECVHKRSAY
jgi:hypothetical protein